MLNSLCERGSSLNLGLKEIGWHQNCCNPEKQKWEMKNMRKDSGFSLMEVMTVIAIIGVIAAIAVPLMIGSRGGANLRGAVQNLKGDMQLAKMKAVQESGSVAVLFSENDYQVVIVGGDTLRNRKLPAGVSIDLDSTDFNGTETGEKEE